MKILVTGGAGFIGSNFVRLILNKYPDYEVINLDELTYAGNLDNLKDVEQNQNYRFVQGDIRDEEVVDKVMNGVDAVVNFAAESHVDRSIGGPADFIQTDVYGTYRAAGGRPPARRRPLPADQHRRGLRLASRKAPSSRPTGWSPAAPTPPARPAATCR